MIEKLSAWTAVLSSIITVGLTVYNATLNIKIEQAKVDLTRVQTEINQKYAELEVRKERTTRYEFVNKLLPDVLKKDRSQVTLTTNLISLSELPRMARSTQHHAARMAHSLLPSAGKTIHPHLQNGVFKV